MNIMVVDDQALFREGLVNMLRSQTDLTVVGEAGTVAEAVAKAHELRPDLILLDYRMPDGNGPDAARMILSDLPKTNIVFLTIHDADTYLLDAVRSGAIGYLVKDITFTRLVDSIQAVANNEPVLSPRTTLSLLRTLTSPKSPGDPPLASLADLNQREIEILKDLARDASNQEIAEHLAISVPTVKKYIHYIFQKLNLKNRKEAGSFAHQQGFEKS